MAKTTGFLPIYDSSRTYTDADLPVAFQDGRVAKVMAGETAAPNEDIETASAKWDQSGASAATQAEVDAGTATDKAVSPETLQTRLLRRTYADNAARDADDANIPVGSFVNAGADGWSQKVAAGTFEAIAVPAQAAPENLTIGLAAPIASDGENGDYWIDTGSSRWAVYGPKAGGSWPTHDGSSFMFGSDLLDEDDMASDSATQGATQQSIRAYTPRNMLSRARREGTVNDGVNFRPMPGTLQFELTSGFLNSINAATNEFEDVAVSGTAPATFNCYLRDGTLARTSVNSFDFSDYDDAGTLGVLGTANAAAHRVFLSADGTTIDILLGQEPYASFSDALSRWISETPVVPAALADHILIGVIVGRQDATDSADVTFVRTLFAGKYGKAVSTPQLAVSTTPQLQLDAGAPWDTATDYVGASNEQFTFTMPATVANGPFITANGQTLEAGQSYIMIYAADRTAADSVAAIGDDPATVAEVALINLIGVAGVTQAELDVVTTSLTDEITTRTADDAALTARLDALPAPFSGNYNDLTNQPAVPLVSTDVDFANDPALVTDRATIKTAIDSLNLGKWLPEVADISTRDALTGVVENDKIRVTDAGSGLWVNFQATQDNPAPTDWQIISEEGAQVPPLSEADAIAGTATTDSAISASTLSATIAARLYYDIRETYGLNQRVYDPASGNYYQSLQAGNINHPLNDAAWWEADLAATTDYIRNLGPVATLTDVDLAAKFPVGDESKPLDIITVGDVAYQMKIGTTNPQVASSWEPVSIPGTLFLNEITIPIRSAGTNAGSSVSIVFYDRNGDTYAPSNFLLNGTLTQYTGGTAEVNFNDTPFNGLIGIGRNKSGAVSFSWNSEVSLMNGLSRVDVVGNSGGSVGGQVSGSFIGVSDAFTHPANAPIVPPEEFTSQKQTAYDDNPDLTVNTGVGMTRQGLQSLFGGVDAAAAWDTDADYTGTDNKPFSLQPPLTVVNGPYVTSDNVVLEAGKTYNLKYQFDRTAVDSVAAFADDAASVAEVALMEYIGVTGTGKADKTLDLNPRFLGGAFKAVITSIPQSLLQDGIGFSDKDEFWVYHAGLSPADVAGMTTLEPDTKANPGVDDGFWVRQGGSGGGAKNALEYPAGNFTALPVNDSVEGADGAVYSLPNIDALQITLPNKADMDLANGIWRVRINGDWASLAAQTTPLSFTDDTANGIEFGAGLPDSGREWVDFILDLAGDRWIAVSGGDVVLSQVLPSYDEHAEVPTAVRLYLATGVGVAAEGLYRKQVSDNSAKLIG